MNVSGKTIIRAGVIAGSLATILGVFVGAISFARPYMQSDNPPLAGMERVVQLDRKFQTLAQFQNQMQQQMILSQKNQLFLAEGFWEKQLADAQYEVRIHPNNMIARQQMITAQGQIQAIQRQLYGR